MNHTQQREFTEWFTSGSTEQYRPVKGSEATTVSNTWAISPLTLTCDYSSQLITNPLEFPCKISALIVLGIEIMFRVFVERQIEQFLLPFYFCCNYLNSLDSCNTPYI